jgi:hypothetical protein
MTKVDRAWFVKGAQLIWTDRDFSKSAAGVDRDVRLTVIGTRNMSTGTLRVKVQHELGYGFTVVVPPGDEIKARIRQA